MSNACSNNACDGSETCTSSSNNVTQGSWCRTPGQKTRIAFNCQKCKQNVAMISGRNKEPLCGECLEKSLLNKLRGLKMNKLLQENEKVAVCISGGVCSMALLYGLTQIQSANKSRLERGKVAMDIVAIHVDDSRVQGYTSAQSAAHVIAIRDAVRVINPQAELHIVPLEAAVAGKTTVIAAAVEELGELQIASNVAAEAEAEDGKNRLTTTTSHHVSFAPQAEVEEAEGNVPHGSSSSSPASFKKLLDLLDSVSDVSGREDVCAHFRDKLLRETAAAAGAQKLLKGHSADAMAIIIMADVSKGRGFSLPSDLHILDAREGTAAPPVLYPFREVSSKELGFLAHLRRVPLDPIVARGAPPARDEQSLNRIAAGFIQNLQALQAGTVFTVLKACTALQPFPWNIVPSSDDEDEEPPADQQRRGPKNQGGRKNQGTPRGSFKGNPFKDVGKPGTSVPAAVGAVLACPLCSLCRAPIRVVQDPAAASETTDGAGGGDAMMSSSTAAEDGTSGDAPAEETDGSSASEKQTFRSTEAPPGPSGAADEEADVGRRRPGSTRYCASCKAQVFGGDGGTRALGFLDELLWE